MLIKLFLFTACGGSSVESPQEPSQKENSGPLSGCDVYTQDDIFAYCIYQKAARGTRGRVERKLHEETVGEV